MIKDDVYYKRFWDKIKRKILIASEMDKENKLVSGSDNHKYEIYSPVKMADILKFEKKNNITLPLNYRTYLQYFGSHGAGPGVLGTFDFNYDTNYYRSVSSNDVTKPCPIKKFDGILGQDEDNEITNEHPIWDENGLVKIATFGNPTDVFLVLNGDAKGEVWTWNYDDYLGAEGQFENWYNDWIDAIIIKLHNYHRFDSLDPSMSLSEMENIMGFKSCRWTHNTSHLKKDEKRYYFRNTAGHILTNKNNKVLKLSKDPEPGFTEYYDFECW